MLQKQLQNEAYPLQFPQNNGRVMSFQNIVTDLNCSHREIDTGPMESIINFIFCPGFKIKIPCEQRDLSNSDELSG